MIDGKGQKPPSTWGRPYSIAPIKASLTGDQQKEGYEGGDRHKGKQRFSIQQLLNESSIQHPSLNKRGSDKDIFRSPGVWMADEPKQNTHMLIVEDPKEMDLFNDEPINLPETIDDNFITNENQDFNYNLLQLEYYKLVKEGGNDVSIDQKVEEEELIVKMLNISHISQERKRDEDPFNSRRESIIEDKFDDLMKIVGRVVNLKSQNKMLNSSVNISRNSEHKHTINKNLFQINQEWENIESTNKEKLAQKENSFLLKDAYYETDIQYEVFTGQYHSGVETVKLRSATLIKKYWLSYKQRKLNGGTNKSKTSITDQIKVEEYFDHQNKMGLLNSLKIQGTLGKPEDFNNLLSQLDESNNNLVDKSQELSLEYKDLNLLIHNKPTQETNSFYQEGKKKPQGESIGLDNLASISMIRSSGKFRHASDRDESGIKEEEDSGSNYYFNTNETLALRQAWITKKSRELKDNTWLGRELDLIAKFRQVLKFPQEPCLAITIQASTTMNPLQFKVQERSSEFKDARIKGASRGPRTLIQRKAKPSQRLDLIKDKGQKDITYIQDKRLNIVLTSEHIQRLIRREIITNDIDLFNGDEDISAETEQILTQLNFSENQIVPTKSRRIRYNIQLQERIPNQSASNLL